jgi:Spy/CpxP family protein refolding chaperone
LVGLCWLTLVGDGGGEAGFVDALAREIAEGSLMKSITGAAMVFGLALGLGWWGAARAQQGAASAPTHPAGGAGGPAMSADTPEDDAALNLTDEQKAQIKTIREDGKAQISAVGKDASLSADAKQQKLKVIRKDIRRQVWSVMTPEQQKQWAAEQRELRAHKHGGDAAADAKPQN